MGLFGKIFGEKPKPPSASSVDRYVGHDQETWRPAEEALEHRFAERRADIAKRELPKSKEDLEMLALVDVETDALREKYGLPPFHVPAENVHFLPPDDPALPKGSGRFSMPDQAVYLAGGRPELHKMLAAFHEMVHMKSFQSVEEDEGKQRIRRGGLRARVEGQEDFAFEALDEAVTEELTKRFVDRMKADPVEHTYPVERQALNLLIDKIAARAPRKFTEREQVFDLFASAAFNGYLLELARTIETSFGQEGLFRRIGECGKDGAKLLSLIESL